MESKISPICIIVCYFGKYPSYIDIFLRSCASNPSIDWWIITDDATPLRFPSNVRVTCLKMEDLQKLFSLKVGFEVNLSDSRLLCDFRPAYGHFFEDSLAKYSFWGHTDFDVAYGDLRKFLPETILASHDRVLCRGHLSLYRNTPEVNQYYRMDGAALNYKDVFRDPVYRQFDEWPGITRILRRHSVPQYHSECLVDVVPPTRWTNTSFQGTEITNYPLQLFYWYKGRVFQAHFFREGATLDNEFAYIHFQKRKFPKLNFDPFAVNGFMFTPKGFIPYDREDLSPQDFANYNQEEMKSPLEIWTYIRQGLKKKIKRGLGEK